MAIIELKLFVSILLPLAAILFIIRGEARTVVIFLLLGLAAELLSAFLGYYILRFEGDSLFFTVNISPAVEEILKGIPILILVFKIRPEKQIIFEAGIAVGIGFAILENAYFIAADAYDTSLEIAFLRGIGTGMMHAVCTLAVSYGMSFIYKKRWFFVPGTFLFLFMAMVYHSVFNALVQSRFQIIGLCLPAATFIPLIVHIIKKYPHDVSAK